MRRRRTAAGLASCLALASAPLAGQELDGALPGTHPYEVRYVLLAADSILSTPHRGVTLEAFRNDTVTGVYLQGTFRGREESVGFGHGTEGLRYLWFSIGGPPGVEYVALLYDLDHDLRAEFLLLRTIDRNRRTDYAIEYRSPSVRETAFDIQLQPACAAPRCDPAVWVARPRSTVHVAAAWFDPWRRLLSLAAVRGERWLCRPVALLPPAGPP